MFTKPEHGWTNLQLGNFSERASYLTDIPIDCLDAFIYALENNSPIAIYFDAEGWDYHLVSSYYESYIIISKDGFDLMGIEGNFKDLAKELVNDIEIYFEDWVCWEFSFSKDEFEERANIINDKLLILKSLI